MAPPKAPAGSGPEAAVAKGKTTQSPPLSPRELHQIVLRAVSLAALAEGPTVPVGSRTERRLHAAFRKIDSLLDHEEQRLPLADVLDSKGSIIGGVTLADFDLVALQSDLRSLCKAQKKLLGTTKYKAQAFSKSVEIAFATAGLPISAASAAEDVELVTTVYRTNSPSSMADVILGKHNLSKARKIQYLLPSLPEARRTRGHLRRPSLNADLAVVQEFLTCLQIHPAEVRSLASTIVMRRMRRMKGRGDYTLRDAAPPLSSAPTEAKPSQ